jgi:hypothetical protein
MDAYILPKLLLLPHTHTHTHTHTLVIEALRLLRLRVAIWNLKLFKKLIRSMQRLNK